MNYRNFAGYSNIPPFYGKEFDAYYDEGNGIPKINENNMTVQDIYRTPFLFMQDHHKNYKNLGETALQGIQCQSELSKLFFSDENMRRLQKMIKNEVYIRTNGQFRLDVDQDQLKLLIAMRAVYMENARFLPEQIVRQVKRLNMKVINEIIPGMLTELRQEHGYLKEINKPLDPIARPVNVNNAGRRMLPPLSSVWGI